MSEAERESPNYWIDVSMSQFAFLGALQMCMYVHAEQKIGGTYVEATHGGVDAAAGAIERAPGVLEVRTRP